MGLVGGFFRDKTPPRVLMLAALLLLTLSQFFAYFENPAMGFPGVEQKPDVVARVWEGLPLTGWELHPQAYVILAVLAFALLRDELAEHALFRRFGYWIALALILAAMSPGAPTRAVGAGMGVLAFLLALIAAIWHQLLPRIVEQPFERGSSPDG